MENTGRSGAIEYQQTIQLDDEIYTVHLLMPSKAIMLSTRLMKLVGEPLAAMAAAGGDQSKLGEVLPLAVRKLAERMDEQQTWTLVQALLSTATQNNKQIPENHFQGRLGHMLQLVAKIVEIQFADFFGAISQSIAGVKATG